MELQTLFLIFHLFGVALGAGGAFLSDGMFFLSIKDKTFSQTEIKFLKLGSRFVWLGLGILILSGIGLFSLDSAGFLDSSKFIAKMTIVGIIIFNGIYFHLSHIPYLTQHINTHFSQVANLDKKKLHLIFSGVISMVSWSWTIILGAMRSLPFSSSQILLAYLLTILGGCLFAWSIRDHLLPHK